MSDVSANSVLHYFSVSCSCQAQLRVLRFEFGTYCSCRPNVHNATYVSCNCSRNFTDFKIRNSAAHHRSLQCRMCHNNGQYEHQQTASCSLWRRFRFSTTPTKAAITVPQTTSTTTNDTLSTVISLPLSVGGDFSSDEFLDDFSSSS